MNWHVAYDFAKDWQTLIAGLMALAAAFIGGRYINRQVIASNDQEQRRWDAKLAAARAVLPLTLSSICEYTQRCAEVLKEIYAARDNGLIPTTTVVPPLPSVPEQAISGLKEMVETGPKEIVRRLAKLIKEIQIQDARLHDLAVNLVEDNRLHIIVTETNIETYIIEAAEIYALAASFFGYARQETEAAPLDIGRERISGALHYFTIYDHDYPEVYRMLDILWPANPPMNPTV